MSRGGKEKAGGRHQAQSAVLWTRWASAKDRPSRGRDALVNGSKDRAAGNSSSARKRKAFLGFHGGTQGKGLFTLLIFRPKKLEVHTYNVISDQQDTGQRQL